MTLCTLFCSDGKTYSLILQPAHWIIIAAAQQAKNFSMCVFERIKITVWQTDQCMYFKKACDPKSCDPVVPEGDVWKSVLVVVSRFCVSSDRKPWLTRNIFRWTVCDNIETYLLAWKWSQLSEALSLDRKIIYSIFFNLLIMYNLL